MIRIVLLLLLPVSAKVVRSKVDEELGQLVVDAAGEDLAFETFQDATIEEAGGPPGQKLSDHRYTRRGGKVPGCEHIVLDHSTMLALWVMDKKPLPESMEADEIVFKCRDGFSTDGNGPFEFGQDNMHVTIKCENQRASQHIASCKPVRCEWDDAHPLFNRQDEFAPEGGIFDAFVLRTVSPVRVEYVDQEKEGVKETYRVIHQAKKEWVDLMGGKAISSSDAKELFTKVLEFSPDFAAGRTEFASAKLGRVTMPQTPEELFAFGEDVHAERVAGVDTGHALWKEARKIQSTSSKAMFALVKKLSPCRPEDKACITHYTWDKHTPGLKDKMREMVFGCMKLQLVMREIVDKQRVSLADRLGHGTHLHLKVKEGLSYSFDGATMAAHTRSIVMYCDATNGLRRGKWYVDKEASKAVLPEEASGTVAGVLAPRYPASEPGPTACESFSAQPGNPVETSGCHGFKRVIKKCADGTVIPEEHLYNEDSMQEFCDQHRLVGLEPAEKLVVTEEEDHYMELIVTHVRAFPIVCRDLLQNPRVAVLQQDACPQVDGGSEDGPIESTYADELAEEEADAKREGLEGAELAARLADRLRTLRERGHPCGLTGWGGLELLGSGRQLTPLPLGHVEHVTCATGYALNGADMRVGEDGQLPRPQTDLMVTCQLDPETNKAIAIQGEEEWGDSPGKGTRFVEKQGLQCVPIQCLAPPALLHHAKAGSGPVQRDAPRHGLTVNQCLVDEAAEPAEWYAYGCDVQIQCEEHFAFPSLSGDGEVLDAQISICHPETRLMTPHHGCVPLMCETPDVLRTSGHGNPDRELVGDHADWLTGEGQLQSGEEYKLPCNEGETTNGREYCVRGATAGGEVCEDNREYVLECVVHKDHEEAAMRQPHLECKNCHHVQSETDLSEEECHPVMCEVPAPTAELEVHFSEEYHHETGFADIEHAMLGEAHVSHVHYKTEVTVRCKEGYELYRDGEKVEDVSSHTWLPLGLCMTNGLLGNDDALLHGQEHAAFALGSGVYHCEKKPDFCQPLWENIAEFAVQNNIILTDPAGIQMIGGSFTFTCFESHKVGVAGVDYYDCEDVECVDYPHEITVTCVADRNPEMRNMQAHHGMYVFGGEAEDVGFHHAAVGQAICVPQVCQVPDELNARGSHGRSTPPGLKAFDKFEEEWILFGHEATFGCDDQLVQRKQFVVSHVAGKQCMKDDEKQDLGKPLPAGRVKLMCESGWLSSYEDEHDPACYGHCGAVLAEPSRAKWNDFLTTTCPGPDGPTECEEGVARHYECDKGQKCRENAQVSCAAVQRMQSLGGRPGVGVAVRHGAQAAVKHLQCEAPAGDEDANPVFHVHSASAGSMPIDAPPAYQELLASCGKQLRVVWEGPDKHIADVCPLEWLVEARRAGDGRRYTAAQAAATGKSAEWADMTALGQVACQDARGEAPVEVKGKCFEAVRTDAGQGELYVTDCDEANVNQRFVFTSPQAEAAKAKGSSGQLVSLMQPEVGPDSQAHLWCVEISEKLDGNAETVKMDYKLAWCATDHEDDDRLFCRGDPEQRASDNGLPACQTLRANLASNDAVEVDAFGGGFGGFGAFDAFNKSMAPTHKTPPANVFSYVQPKRYFLEVKGAWATTMAAVEGQGKTVAIAANEATKTSQGPVNRYDASEESRASVEAFFKSIDHPAARGARVRNVQLFNGAMEGMRLNVEFRLQEFDSFGEAAQDDFFGKVSAAGFAHQRPPRNSPLVEQAACGDNEQCGFLYFLHKSTVFDPTGASTGKKIHECAKTGAFPADACKFEMFMEAKNPNKKQRIMGNGVYQVCYSNDLSECEGM